MAHTRGEIVELRWESGGTAACLRLPAVMHPAPGQYLLGYAEGQHQVLPAAIFPAGPLEAQGLPIASPLPADWGEGTRLALRGPLGRGFRLPTDARRVALAALDTVDSRLLPLAHLALEQGAAVVLYSAHAPARLPADVEVLPLDDLADVSAWADYLALDLPRALLPDLPARLGWKPFQPRPRAEALVITAMPCGGPPECGICAVPTSKGAKLACKDGPVFSLAELVL